MLLSSDSVSGCSQLLGTTIRAVDDKSIQHFAATAESVVGREHAQA